MTTGKAFWTLRKAALVILSLLFFAVLGLYAGLKLSAFADDEGSSATYYVDSSNGNDNSNNGTSSSTPYKTIGKAVEAGGSGIYTIQLMNDISVESTVTISQGTVTLDLNGKSIYSTVETGANNGYLLEVANTANDATGTVANVTIKNSGSTGAIYGTVLAYGNVNVTVDGVEVNCTYTDGNTEHTYGYGIRVGYNGNTDLSKTAFNPVVTVKNSTVKNASVAGIVVFGSNSSSCTATLNVENSTVSGAEYGISGNGTTNNWYTAISITNSTITATNTSAGGTGIYHPQYGTLTIDGSSTAISGYQSAIEIRAGVITIKDGTFTATAETFSTETSNNSTTITGAAIAISPYKVDSAGTITVNLKGGTYNGVYSVYEGDYTNGYNANITETAEITGGTYNGSIYATNIERFVTGGTFNVSDYNVLDYIATANEDTTVDVEVNITLAADVYGANVVVPAGVTATIDLNGYTLTNAASGTDNEADGYIAESNDHTITVDRGATLTIKDDSSDNTGKVDNITHSKAAVYNYGTAVIESGTYTRSAEHVLKSDDSENSNSWYLIENEGTMTIDGGLFYTGSQNSAAYYGTESSLIRQCTSDSAKLTITGGEFYNAADVIKIETGDFTVTGGTFTMDNSVNGWYGGNNIIQLKSSGTVKISNATLTALGNGQSGNSSYSDGYYRCGITLGSTAASSASVTIEGVTLSMEGTDSKDVGIYNNSQGAVTINSGAYSVASGSKLLKTGTTGVLRIYGGVFVNSTAAAYAASGYGLIEETSTGSTLYEMVKLSDLIKSASSGTYYILSKGIITEYTEAAAAVSAVVESGGDLAISEDITLGSDFTVSADVEISLTLNGNTLTVESTIEVSGSLTLSGGVLEAAEGVDFALAVSGGSLTVSGMTINAGLSFGSSSDSSAETLSKKARASAYEDDVSAGGEVTADLNGNTINGDLVVNEGEITITNCTVQGDITINGGSVTINGGTYYGNITVADGAGASLSIKSGTFSVDVRKLGEVIADGSTCSDDVNGIWIVSTSDSTFNYIIDSVTGNVYQYVDGIWAYVTNIMGRDGATWTVGTGAPTEAGSEGDLYLDSSSWDVYVYSGGSWSKLGNIKGSDGATGAAGEAGTDGTDSSFSVAEVVTVSIGGGIIFVLLILLIAVIVKRKTI